MSAPDDPQTEYMLKIADNIREHGWVIQGVLPTEDQEPKDQFPFAYTIGLIQRGVSAEALIVGLPMEVAAGLLNEIAAFTLANSNIPPSEWDLDGGYVLKPVFASHLTVSVPVGVARAYYQTAKVPMVQYVWPSKEFKYPWDDGWPEELLQPVGGRGKPIGS